MVSVLLLTILILRCRQEMCIGYGEPRGTVWPAARISGECADIAMCLDLSP